MIALTLEGKFSSFRGQICVVVSEEVPEERSERNSDEEQSYQNCEHS